MSQDIEEQKRISYLANRLIKESRENNQDNKLTKPRFIQLRFELDETIMMLELSSN